MVLAIPATAVIAGAVMLVLASATWDGLVADDYYKRGMQINRSLARSAEATRLGLEATLAFPAPGVGLEATLAFPAPGVVEARLTGAVASPDDERLILRFDRAARAGADVRIRMLRGAGGVWRGVLPALPPGKWYVELGGERWRLTAPVWMPAATGELVLRAPAPRPARSALPRPRS